MLRENNCQTRILIKLFMKGGEIKAFSGKIWKYLPLIDVTKGTIKRCTLVRKKSKRERDAKGSGKKKNGEYKY